MLYSHNCGVQALIIEGSGCLLEIPVVCCDTGPFALHELP